MTKIIKICKVCNAEYETHVTKINRKGRCLDCKNKNARDNWKLQRERNGIEVFSFQKLLNQGLKRCTKCKEIKSVDLFSKRDKTKFRTSCKKCDSAYSKKYESENKNRINTNRRIRRKDPIRGIIFSQRDRQRSLFKQKGKYKSQAQTELIREWLGCSVDECRKHLESLFAKGMTWDNRGMGSGMWQIDHKIPISLTEIDEHSNIIDNDFNRKIWHYSNLQPLWHSDNAKKSNKYILSPSGKLSQNEA